VRAEALSGKDTGAPSGKDARAEPTSSKTARARERVERDRIERERRKRKRAREKLEGEITALEQRLGELTAAMEDDSAKGDIVALRRASEEYADIRQNLDALLSHWAEIGE